jgi:NAD(P) transhydrogenase subunit alpha
MKRGCIHISYLDPFNEHDLVRAFAEHKRDRDQHGNDPRSTRSRRWMR